MADSISKERRSWNMSRIRSKDTKPELLVRSILHKKGYRFRLHQKNLPGKPDIVLSKYRTCIFVQGCFWHQHKGCIDASKPKTNSSYWQTKLKRNKQRDQQNYKKLVSLGWQVIIFWECELRDVNNVISNIKLIGNA
ncbi:MAG: very short patch repair endonuclease [Sedimentisphaerales bacterium]|jgi:DNA mismatch endonuclease (patch repair protein)